MSSYGGNKTIAAIVLTIAIIIGLRVVAETLILEPPTQQEKPKNSIEES